MLKRYKGALCSVREDENELFLICVSLHMVNMIGHIKRLKVHTLIYEDMIVVFVVHRVRFIIYLCFFFCAVYSSFQHPSQHVDACCCFIATKKKSWLKHAVHKLLYGATSHNEAIQEHHTITIW